MNRLRRLWLLLQSIHIRLFVWIGDKYENQAFKTTTQKHVSVYHLPRFRANKDIIGVYLDGKQVEYSLDAEDLILKEFPIDNQELLVEYIPKELVEVK